MNWLVIESLGAIDMVQFRSYRSIIYRRQRFSVRIVRFLMPLFGFHVPILKRLEIGSVQCATGLRKEAYEVAESAVSDICSREWIERVRKIFWGLDVELLVEKYLFEARYDRYFFRLLCIQLALENPKVSIRTIFDYFDANFMGRLEQSNVANIILRVRTPSSSILFFSSVLSLPLLLFYHLIRHVRWGSSDGTGMILCSVDAPVTLRMMKDIFGDFPYVCYVSEQEYRSSFKCCDQVMSLGLSFWTWSRYLRLLPAFLLATLVEWRSLRDFAKLPSDLYHLMLKAEAITPSGHHMSFVTAGHLNLERSARNALLRTRGSTSINISKNSYVNYCQFPAEWKMNYDAFAAAGQQAIDLYRIKRCLSTLILSGSYDTHRPLEGDPEVASMRRSKLKEFSAGARLVVFLSPGVCDETLSHEIRLMVLLRQVAQLPNTRVILRLKPSAITRGYESFYKKALDLTPNVLVTAEEFDLFDFIGPTALFVTSISSSAFDIALRGGKVMFIDFMQTPDMYVPWQKFPSTVTSESAALAKIKAHLEESFESSCVLKKVYFNREFLEYIGCQFGQFSEYRQNLLLHIAPWLRVARLAYGPFQRSLKGEI